MAHRLRIFLFLLIGVFSADRALTQCTGGTNGGSITPTATWQTVANINSFSYRTFTATAGNVYYFSFCTADGGSSTFDTQLTINDNAGTAVPGAYNDDYCGLQSYVAWTCLTSGTYRVLPTKFTCANQNNLGTLAYRVGAALSCPNNLGGGVTTVPSLPYASGAGTTCGAGNDLTTNNATTCGSTLYLGGEDAVWIFTPSSTGTVTINLTSSGTYNGLTLFQGCPLTGQGGTCLSASQSSAGNQTITACVTSGVTYYIILDSWPSPTCNPYSNLTISAPVSASGCSLGNGAVNISLPYTSNGRSTCGATNNQTASNTITCGSANYLSGEDEVFVFTPATSGNINITLTSTGSYTGMMLYNGCPLTTSCSGAAGTCVAFEQSSSGNKSLCANVVAGQTYYLIIDSWAAPACNPYNISISAPSAALAGATCANAVSIASLPYSVINESTACTGNNYTNASTGSCGTLYESGEDKVYVYTAAQAECIGITLSGASSNSIGYQVYLGCPGQAGATCIGSNGGANSGTLTGSVVLPSPGTYYIVIDSWAPPANVSYNIAVTSYGNGAPNDLPCNATPLILGIPLSSANTCAGGAGEPVAPVCWTTPNTLQTVWYSFQAPASGNVRARVTPGSLTNPQMAMYAGTCGSGMTLVAGSCNDNGSPCGTTTNYSSEFLVSGLTPGTTYFIVVDGYANLSGTFSVLVMDGSVPLVPLTNGQDCGNYLAVCDTTMSFGDPGFQAFGNICDFVGGGANCLVSGERGSVWFDIPINANGSLEFTVVPKDWAGAPSTAGTDYDFAIWKIAGSGSVTCAQIASGSPPVACNYSSLGVTGLFSATAGTSPPAYPNFGLAFEARIAVSAGERYALVVSNFSNSTSGFDIIFNQQSPVLYGSSGNASVWSGGVDTDWYKQDNWGGCPTPNCGRDAVINGGIVLQPTITGVASCKSLLINAGAVLTIPAGQTLSICENFTNFGTLTAANTSTVLFGNAAVPQAINGNLTGANAFGNLTVTKTGGVVTQLQNLDAKGNFTISNSTSSYNTTSKWHRVAGNFRNSGTYTAGTGTLEFNGTTPQTYSNLTAVNNVLMNHTGSGLTLLTNMVLANSGVLTLTAGKIITTPTFEVNVLNPAPGATSVGNTSSFVQGFLRRSLSATGSFDFPVGESTKGYQRATINFAYPSAPTTISNLRVNFSTYAALPGPLGVIDCGVTFSSNALNNGKWTFVASNNPTSGNYDLTLYNLNYTNMTNAWTIMSNVGSGWTLASGTCIPGSPVTAVRRNGMNGMADFGTAQGPSALPVTWLGVLAEPLNNTIRVKWTTAQEENNDGFELARCDQANHHFVPVGWVDGSGNSSVLQHYYFDDHGVVPGKEYYYRIRQVDYNGSSSYSPVVSARLHPVVQPLMEVYPNPIRSESTLRFNHSNLSDVNVCIYNHLGQKLYCFTLQGLDKGDIHIPITDLLPVGTSSGLYTIRLDAGLDKYTCKVVLP